MIQKPKILHIITNLPIGGAQDNTLITVERLNRERYSVALMCAPDGEWVQRAREIPGLDLIFVPNLIQKINLLKDFAAFWNIYKYIRRGQFEIVHTHSSKPGFLGRIAARIAGVPIIIHTIHGFPFNDFMNPFLRKIFILIERLLTHFSDCLVTVSKLNLEKAVKLRIAKRQKFVNIYSGIDFKKFDIKVDVKSKRSEIGIVDGRTVVGMVGRLSQQKAPWNFIKSVPHVLERYKNAVFLIVGDGELMSEMKKLACDLGINDNVLFLGFRDDLPEILRILDIYVLTSQWEGLGRSLTEAMYVGCPVIATGVEGVPELVQNDETGVLVPVNDPVALSKEINKMLLDKEKRNRLGRMASLRINQSFKANIMVKKIDELYQRLCASLLKSKNKWS